jgi:sec-independent protein translocase protein TatA
MQPNPMLAIFNLGGGEIILVLAVALLLFGGKKLPELAKGLGNGIREFKKATGNASEELRQAIENPLPVAPRRWPPALSGTEYTVSQISPEPKILQPKRIDFDPPTPLKNIQ